MATTHGMYGTPEYKVWSSMKARCLNPNSPGYQRYGGRGITVCDRWLKFENFYNDMGPRPAGMTLERKDNDKGYAADNCIWADRKTQQRNRRTVRDVTFNGRTQSIAAWAEETGIPHATLTSRFNWGWSAERALTTPPVPSGRLTLVTYGERTQSVAAWSRETGINPETLRARLKAGWPVDRALTTRPVPGGRYDA